MSGSKPGAAAFEKLTGDDGVRDATEARNGFRHVAALSMTKISDGLIDPKLVLSWLLNAAGAPAYLVGALVPVREAGALLPQILLAGQAERMRRRKWMWAVGSAIQGMAALAIAVAGWLLDGPVAGFAILGCLALLALARAACSVSYKDVLGRTIGQSRRGAVTGFAASAASVAVLVFALLLMSGLMQARTPVLIAIALAGLLWLCAAALFSRMEEAPDEGAQSAGPARFREVLSDAGLRHFILVRGLLVSTALAPPYLVLLAQGEGNSVLRQLGTLVLASAAASFLSSYVWGRLADRSARLVLALCGAAGAGAMAAALLMAASGALAATWAAPAVLFWLMVAYHGVRQARSVWLVDYAPEDDRAAYTAVANTAIGGILLVSGLFGGALASVSAWAALAGLCGMATLGGLLALRLPRAAKG
ncbi:MAG: MFS transporter [Pseudooceanicola sp.]